MNPLEMWAGVESSCVRVGDACIDQLELTGHTRRAGDIDRIASFGVRAVRFPVLWERAVPEPGAAPSWTFSDDGLAKLRERGIRPIVGLVHHGSGPLHTSLVEDSFVTGLADLARRVAERYPRVTDWTPINEPLTTARFSALYGHWYPHAPDPRLFARAVLIECRAIRAAMRAIREVVPQARLVQTEDLGTVYSTPPLAYQADYENARRFLSLDLLAGRVGPDHPLRGWLVGHGLDPHDLDDFGEDPCVPDLIGLNYYVTSDRFLDHRAGDYPAHVRGGKGIDVYADVEAVRVREEGISGHRALLELLWDRYRRPPAVTEAHLGCTPEEQIRWLREAWDGACAALASGVDVRAVTLWSVFGAFDWDSLLTRSQGHYEPERSTYAAVPCAPRRSHASHASSRRRARASTRSSRAWDGGGAPSACSTGRRAAERRSSDADSRRPFSSPAPRALSAGRSCASASGVTCPSSRSRGATSTSATRPRSPPRSITIARGRSSTRRATSAWTRPRRNGRAASRPTSPGPSSSRRRARRARSGTRSSPPISSSTGRRAARTSRRTRPRR